MQDYRNGTGAVADTVDAADLNLAPVPPDRPPLFVNPNKYHKIKLDEYEWEGGRPYVGLWVAVPAKLSGDQVSLLRDQVQQASTSAQAQYRALLSWLRAWNLPGDDGAPLDYSPDLALQLGNVGDYIAGQVGLYYAEALGMSKEQIAAYAASRKNVSAGSLTFTEDEPDSPSGTNTSTSPAGSASTPTPLADS
jgi:hypothetical protein